MLQGHPRPWPVAKPRTLWVPAHKVPGTYYRQCSANVYPRFQPWWYAGILPPPRTPAWDKEVVHVRCAPVGNSLVVAPVLGRSAAKDQAVGRAASLVFVVSTPRYGFAVFIYTCPLFLHTSAVVNHAGSVPGVQGQPFRLLAQRMSGSAFGGL